LNEEGEEEDEKGEKKCLVTAGRRLDRPVISYRVREDVIVKGDLQ